MDGRHPLAWRIVGGVLIVFGLVAILTPFVPGILLFLAGVTAFSPKMRHRLREWRDRMIYRRSGGR